MLKKIVLASSSVILMNLLYAQAKDGSKQNKSDFSFTSINQVGFVIGEGDDSYQLQTVNGLKYKTWIVGAGVGIDGYRYRSVPVFLQVRKEFSLSNYVFFLYNDIGLNYPWVKDSQKNYYGPSSYTHGIYYDGGVGYRLPLKRQSLLFSSGFSLKKMKEERSMSGCPFVGPCFENKDVYQYSLKRLSFKIGLQL